jgi:SnoaL-like domain
MTDKDELLYELDAHKQIQAVIIRAARGYDRCDRELIRSAYHPDAWDDHGVFSGPVEAFVDWVIPLHQALVWTSHYVTNIHIELDGDMARCESYVIANLRYEQDGALHDLLGCGRYFDRFERRNGKWLIAHRHAIGDWNRVDRVDAQFEGELVKLLETGKRGKDDPSYAHFAGARPERRVS